MKLAFILSIATALVSISCKEGASSTSPTDTNASGSSVITAPVDYLDAAGKAQQHAVKTVDTAALTQAIQLFHVEKGRYPNDLNELVSEKFIPRIPETPHGTTIDYNVATGTFQIVKR